MLYGIVCQIGVSCANKSSYLSYRVSDFRGKEIFLSFITVAESDGIL